MSAVDLANVVHCPSRGSVTLGECLEDFREDDVNRHVAGARPTSCSRCSQGRTRKAAAEGRRVPPATTATPAPRPVPAPVKKPKPPAPGAPATAPPAPPDDDCDDGNPCTAETPATPPAAASTTTATAPVLAVDRATLDVLDGVKAVLFQLADVLEKLPDRLVQAATRAVAVHAVAVAPPRAPATTATPAPPTPATPPDERMARVAAAARQFFYCQNRPNRRELDLAIIDWDEGRQDEPSPARPATTGTPARKGPQNIPDPIPEPAPTPAPPTAARGPHRAVKLDSAPTALLRATAAAPEGRLVIAGWLAELGVESKAGRMRYWRAGSWATGQGYLRRVSHGVYEVTDLGREYIERVERTAAAAGADAGDGDGPAATEPAPLGDHLDLVEALRREGLSVTVRLDGAPARLLRAAVAKGDGALPIAELTTGAEAKVQQALWTAARDLVRRGLLRLVYGGVYEATPAGREYARRLQRAAAAAGVTP